MFRAIDLLMIRIGQDLCVYKLVLIIVDTKQSLSKKRVRAAEHNKGKAGWIHVHVYHAFISEVHFVLPVLDNNSGTL